MITHHKIHFVKLPPIENVDPPSSRRAIPARTRHSSAIAGSSWIRRRMMSANICGVGIRISLGLEGRGHVIRRERYPEYGARESLDYETPPTPCRTQNSSNRVTPDTASSMAEASSHRPKVRPDIKATTAPKTAPPAPTGATTLPIQLTKLKNAPSGCAPVCP